MHFAVRTAFLVVIYMSTCVGQCPEKWFNFQESCFGFIPLRKTWLDAESTCQSLDGGHLVAPTTYLKDLNLKGFLQLQNHKDPVWIDGTDQMEIGFWVWTSTLEKMNYTKWLPGEPNDLNKSLCVAVIDGDDNWRSRACSDQNTFVCEIPAKHEHGGIVG